LYENDTVVVRLLDALMLVKDFFKIDDTNVFKVVLNEKKPKKLVKEIKEKYVNKYDLEKM